MSKFTVNLYEVIYSLSDALDLVGIMQIHHGKRVAYMAVECAIRLGWSVELTDTLFQASILHDCGVSNTIIHSNLTQFEWEHEMDHCQIGADMIGETTPISHLKDYILNHHTHYSKLKDMDIPETVKLISNLIYLTDRVDILSVHLASKNPNILLHRETIQEKIRKRSGTFFNPELVEGFLMASAPSAFWLSLDRDHLNDYVDNWVSHNTTKDIEFSELKSLVQIFSRIVDSKSMFTSEHSEGVARLSRYLGELFNLSEHTCDKLELAGLLHDLGKLRVPDEILEKPSALTTAEYLTIQRHSFDGFNILKQVNGFEEIALWSAQHHERLDGTGYPFRHAGNDLSLEARIIAVADVFQALAQKRPYREKLKPDEILSILEKEANANKLDIEVVRKVKFHLEHAWKKAMLIE
ncbi:MAG: HD domain-containing protein [Leptospiraceae bacterium]|nr:HD domain-containing protein [Leptospiraceae bacterium]MCP5510839.1 HD domain-containing protein [Leptospiraceae bacterium]